MGRPRVKIIDDSQEETVVKNKLKRHPELVSGSEKMLKPFDKTQGKQVQHDNGKKEEDSLVAKLKEEMGIEEKPQPADTSEGPARSADGSPVETPGKPEVTTVDTSEVSEGEKLAEPAIERIKKTRKPGKAKPRSKKYLEAIKDLDRSKFYPLTEAVDLVKKVSYSKFDGTLEAHINTHTTGIRGLISLPYASGKKIRILAFPSTTLGTSGKGNLEKEGVVFGDDSTLDNISKGKIEFDILITTPDWMPKMAKLAKILGPKGLMPNPKNGTITEDLIKSVESFQGGKTEYKTEPKVPVIHLAFGKLTQPNEELEANIKTLYQILGKSRISKITLSPTMGPGVKLDLSSI